MSASTVFFQTTPAKCACLGRPGDGPVRPKIITPAGLYEMFTRNSQCVLNQTGRCPLLVFTKQLCEELNSFFNED
jgi:hypothetical protein